MTGEIRRTSRARDFVIMALLILAGVGAIAGFGFYHREIGGYLRLQGWNLQPLQTLTARFVEAAAADRGDEVAALVSPQAGDLKVIREGDRVVALTVYSSGANSRRDLTRLAPSASAEIGEPALDFTSEAVVVVPVLFPGSHTLEIRWDRTQQGWQVVGITQMQASR